MTSTNILHLCIRSKHQNPNHHLYSNNGTWWCHFTLKTSAGTSVRKRISLKTKSLEIAVIRRDKILNAVSRASGHIAA